MTATHDYLSTACWHELNDGRPTLHNECRATCKYGPTPEYCGCPNHREGEEHDHPVSWVDQARGIALRLHDVLQTVGVDLAVVDRHLARAIAEDRFLFWLRGEEQPSGEWRDAKKDHP